MKFFTRSVSLVLTFFLLITIFPITANAASTRQEMLGVAFVTASALRLRSDATTASATLAYASQDEVVVLMERIGDWYKVNYNLQVGYMHKNHLRAATRENVELGYGQVNGSAVNIRSGPSTNYTSISKAYSGETAYIIGINTGWYKVIFKNVVGYIRSDYLDLTEIPYENKDSDKKPIFFKGGKSTGTPVSPEALSSVSAQAIIATAKQYIGVPYVWGGSSPSGFDCSGFTQYVFAAHGITLPRTSTQQYSTGTWVSKGSLQPGDLVFYNTSGSGVSHLGIYIGNGQFIHASTSKGVIISEMSNSYWSARYYGARRVL